MKFFLWDLAEHPAKVELFLLTLTQQQYTRVKAEHCDAASCTVNFRNHALASRWGRKKKQKVKKCWEKLEHPLRWGNMSICIICILLLSFYILFSSSCFRNLSGLSQARQCTPPQSIIPHSGVSAGTAWANELPMAGTRQQKVKLQAEQRLGTESGDTGDQKDTSL